MIFLELEQNTKFNWLKQIFYSLQNHPTFHPDESLVNLVKERECFAGLSMLFIFALYTLINMSRTLAGKNW